jgi:phosphoribosyl 1,2-cyclic phosphodiesterase
MSLVISSLNSGSNGNCYYIGNEQDAVFIDAGISLRETEIRMKRSELNIKKIRAIFISHEHTDHISGVTSLSKKYQLPVYVTEGTQKPAGLRLEKHLVKRFHEYDPVQIGDLTVTAFTKFHDAEDPHSFTVSSPEVTVGIFTDIGKTCKNLIRHFKQCHAAFLEANYDEDMLMNGNYPYVLKKRISGKHGHLSNMEALELFKKHRPSFMSHLILSHLSENNNKPELVEKLFKEHAFGTEIIIASRFKETGVFYINPLMINGRKAGRRKINDQQQLSLF